MSMRRLVILVSLLLALGSAACGDGAKEIFDTAEFEELQNNIEHARQLYRRIIEQYPDSQFAGKAQGRLREMGPAVDKK